MKLAVLALLLAQAPAPQAQVPQAPTPQGQPPAEEQAAAEVPPVDPYPGPLVEGLRELAGSSRAEEHARVLELAPSLLASPEVGRISELQRARLRYDVGIARALAGASGEAVADLRAAAGLAGPGELRADSMYAAGTARLLAAEQLRLAVPEIAKKLGLEPPAPPTGAAPLGAPPGGLPLPDPKAPDPIELAKAAYMLARSELLERLELDWRGADTRANLELVARRLRELDAIERQREEEQQEQQNPNDQQQQQQQQDQPPDQDQKQDPSQEQKPPEEQPGESEDQPPEQEPGQEQPPEQQPEPSEQQDQQPKPEPGKQEEKVLSKEEVQRLLDRLQQIEEQAQALRAMLRERRRVPVEKDW